jgi:lysophospholipase L1-like esterase
VRSGSRASRALILAVVGATTLGGCGSGADDGAAYAALGDSYSSGAGIAPLSDQACQRSTSNYASLVAHGLRSKSFKDVTCGGATTADLTDEQSGTSNDPQLDAVGRDTRLVTLTIGLNDDKISSALLYACLAPSGVPSEWCKQLYTAPDAAAEKVLADAADRVQKVLELVRKRAPDAQLVLVGYPRLFPDSGSCPDRVPMAEQMVPKVRSAMATANDEWRQAAASAGADYVDTWTMSKGHDVCSDDPWVNGVDAVPGIAAALHPFESFHRAVAAAIVKLVKKQ